MAGERGQRPGGRRHWWLAAVGALLVGAAIFAATRRGEVRPREILHLTGTTMATTYSVKVVGPGFAPADRGRLTLAVERELERVNAAMSRYREGSDLDRLNRSRSEAAQPIPADLAEILGLARSISELSNGAYDVTVGPLVRLWGFDDESRLAVAPAPEALAAARERVGFGKLEIDPSGPTARKLHPELDIDLSSIAKGWGVDRVALALEASGQRDYLVEIGGEVRAAGRNHRGEPWRVGVEQPLADRREVFEVAALSGMSMATSGDYRNFYVLDGRQVSHTIDPRTGRPVEHGLASVTVLDPSCARADGLATALTVLGPVLGPALADREGLAALFLIRRDDGTFERRATAAFDGR
ncbi:MAG TPA: FAD:protein FMN transferase [Polyangia bacterium]|nr:FAD:protein FMN transferase [Polyangia bacterium]